MTILRTALIYWACIFALGFALGTLRVLWGAQAIGETGFLSIEVPTLLGASALAARWLLRRNEISELGDAFLMGAVAYALLMAAEFALASGFSGLGAREWLTQAWSMPHMIGSLGQTAFGLMPVMLVSFRKLPEA